jgi:hypothetical protein
MAEDDDKFAVYLMAVEMADRVSSRRMLANGFFLSVHTALVTILGFSYESLPSGRRPLLLVISMMGFVLAITWLFALRSYRRLNRAKFNVINEIETSLPEQYFSKEWAELTRTTAKDVELKGLRERWIRFNDRYTTLTNVESIVPLVFALIYIALLLAALTGVVT